MEGTVFLIVVVGVWMASARYIYLCHSRSSFWKYPGIWIPSKDKQVSVLFSLMGPFAIPGVILLNQHGYPPIPKLAYILDKEYPVYGSETSMDRWQTFSYIFKGDRRKKGHDYRPMTLYEAQEYIESIDPQARIRKILAQWN